MWKAQNGTCALTGEKLIPGKNASLDHIVPRCRGGGNDNNLQWVTKEANYFKRARTNEELIRMSVKIAKHLEHVQSSSNVVPINRSNAAEG